MNHKEFEKMVNDYASCLVTEVTDALADDDDVQKLVLATIRFELEDGDVPLSDEQFDGLLTPEQANVLMTTANFLSTLWYSYFDDPRVLEGTFRYLKEGALEYVQDILDEQDRREGVDA
jgi:hypothetical protein